MTEKIDERALLQQAIQDLEPQVPIRSWKREDHILILHLADGNAIFYDWQKQEVIEQPEMPAFETLLKKELQEIAADMGITGYSSMTKAELIAAIEGDHDA